jgi:DNA mismatch repair protein MutS2
MITEGALALLEFPKLLSIISAFSHSDASRKAVLDIHPLYEKEDIDRRLGGIREIRRMSAGGSPLGLTPFPDISPLLLRLRPEGAVLEPAELSAFIPVFTILSDISVQLAGRDDLPFLKELAGSVTGFPGILAVLRRSVDSEGNILDSASFALSELRGQVRRLEAGIGKRLEELMRDERISVFLQDTFITQRSGRWVIPVRMDSKGQVPGVVHDVSRSGETAFVEPLALIGLSNELENLIAEQKAEEIRILRDICSRIRTIADDLETQYRVIVNLDLLNCIAEFSERLRMQNPVISDSGVIRLVDARHPLLALAFRKTERPEEVVPLNVELGGDRTVMVITGSNAGGKTIAIKTVGLLQLMALSGMPVPADSSSSFPLVNDILIDIGDEQSIESSLSTFSAHVSNIAEILKRADSRSLVLVDELGTGTDPDEGAALACAVLKEIREKGALLFATTHLTDIKGFVHRMEGMINASMEFDQKTLTPLFRLRVGEPGRSHALEIAQRYGLPESVIDSARGLLGGIKVEFDNLIADLNAKRAWYETALGELKELKRELEERNGLLKQRLAEAESGRRDILAKAYKEATEVITATKREMNALLKEIREKEKEKRREAIKQVEAVHQEVVRKTRDFDAPDYAPPAPEEIRAGDTVFVRSLGSDASVLGVDEKRRRVRVRSGNVEIEVPVSDIGYGRGGSGERKPIAVHFEGAMETVSSRVNLVGLRVDEALSILEPFLNHASLAGLAEVTVIHGFGTGILARAVRGHLDGHPLVKMFRKGERDEGGAGVTVVALD